MAFSGTAHSVECQLTESSCVNFFAFQAVTATTINVTVPPKITDGTTLMSLAAKPDSNAPISLEDPTNILLTADTLPFMFSGVSV